MRHEAAPSGRGRLASGFCCKLRKWAVARSDLISHLILVQSWTGAACATGGVDEQPVQQQAATCYYGRTPQVACCHLS
jgi:hypothetical protein